MPKYFFFLVLFTSLSVFADNSAKDDGAYLDPKYVNFMPPEESLNTLDVTNPALAHSDTDAVINFQTPVRSQMARGTCSIFSATALLESLLIRRFNFGLDLDLSEEFLDYLIQRQYASGGSNSDWNFEAFAAYGSPAESTLPYIGETWDSVNFSAQSLKRCGHLINLSWNLDACLKGHYDPDLLTHNNLMNIAPKLYQAKTEAQGMRDRYLSSVNTQPVIYLQTVEQIKALLRANTPITMDADFYYGAWNHRRAESLGIPRNKDLWSRGIVGYPEPNSKDREYSRNDPAGHSIVIVGYDDNVTITLPTTLLNGTVVNKTYRGVYYFKNSWGTESFGIQTQINGIIRPGYGIITQKYAHEFGTFFQLPL